MLKDVFIEAFRHQLLPLFSEITLPAMRAFGGFAIQDAVAAALLGSALAVFVLFRIGRVVSKFWQAQQPERNSQLCQRFQPYTMGLMVFVATPFGFLIAFAAGLLGAPIKYAMPLALLGLGLSYGAQYYG